jgi:acetyltransferase-like isoleucine patch superfamily enzyme/putative methionine-R-sulfoxide reductase with GAF domain
MDKQSNIKKLLRLRELLVTTLLGSLPTLAWGVAARQTLYPPIFRHMGKKVFIQDGVEFISTDKIDIGNEVYLFRNAKLNAWNNNCKILLGDRVAIERGVDISCSGDNCTIEIGDGTFIGPYTCIGGPGQIAIGKDCMIAAHSGIVANNHIFVDPVQKIRDQGVTKKGIEIGDDCWLGFGVKVLDGVTIGKGSVIGAGAVVTKDIPPYSIAVGVPAKVISNRQAQKDFNLSQQQHCSVKPAVGELENQNTVRDRHQTVVSDDRLAQPLLENLLQALLECIQDVMKVDTVTLLLHAESEKQLAVRATLGLEEEIETGVRIPIGRGFAGKIAAQNKLMKVEDISRIEVVSPVLRQKGLRSMLGVPLVVEDKVIGVFHVGTLHPRYFSDDEVQTLRHVADRLGVAVAAYQKSEIAANRSRHLLSLTNSEARRLLRVADRYNFYMRTAIGSIARLWQTPNYVNA